MLVAAQAGCIEPIGTQMLCSLHQLGMNIRHCHCCMAAAGPIPRAARCAGTFPEGGVPPMERYAVPLPEHGQQGELRAAGLASERGSRPGQGLPPVFAVRQVVRHMQWPQLLGCAYKVAAMHE
jgi:hypothetical protein